MLTLDEILAATGARLSGTLPGHTRFEAVVTDSRALTPGCLFVCLRGERFDGHTFAEQALASGARAVLIAEDATPIAGPALVVPDTQRGYQQIARAYRRKLGPLVVGVTGSSGKTSTKEQIAAYLGLFGQVLKTEANHNNEIGVPQTLLRLAPADRVAVIEMGMRGPGEIAELTDIAEPDVGVITNIGTAHIGRLGSIEAIAQAKGELWRHLPEGGIAVVNLDDPRCVAQAEAWGGRQITFSLTDPAATVWADDVQPEGLGQVFTAYWKSNEKFDHPEGTTLRFGRAEVHLPFWGDHHRANALAAIAVGWALGVTPPKAFEIVPESLPGRVNTVSARGVTLIDDAYNANPDSMRAALKSFSELPARGRRFAVLGDMGELGEQAEEAHRELGAYAAGLGLDGLVAVGKLAIHYGTDCPDCLHFEEGDAACAYLLDRLKPGDRVLLKASRAARFETLMDYLQDALGDR
ncbi:MAG TPA: UDP-N-acetylmuramoyl-tripeptide--D-alanyl-D-alanine ligase [Oscillatoriaceae cyanobacterium]